MWRWRLGSELRRITQEGDKEIAGIDLGPVKVVHWTSKEGVALEGIATFPAGYVEGQEVSVPGVAAWRPGSE
jgi:dipeptidyl aminopeptidase/acylaminoacyl peptidase